MKQFQEQFILEPKKSSQNTAAMCWPGVDVDDIIEKLIDLEDVAKVARVLQRPQLRGAIFSSITASDSTFCIHFKSILKEF